MINTDYWEYRYNILCKKLSSLFHPMTSNICLICKKYDPTYGCLLPKGQKCSLDPDEDKLNEE